MTNNWEATDLYFEKHLHTSDSVMEATLCNNEKANLPAKGVSASQGKLLYLLAQLKEAKSILEIGTLGGYSAIWMAKALPEDGRLVTLEYESSHAKIARENIKTAGLENKIEVIEGAALDSLPALKNRESLSFDFIFIDADKKNNANYLKWALELSVPGAVIIIDNVVRKGRVLDDNAQDPSTKGVREVVELMSKEPRIDSTAIQTVGSKGYDGFILGIVK